MRNLTNMLYQHFTMIPARIGRREMTRNEAIKFAKETILAYTSEMAEFKALAIEALEKMKELEKGLEDLEDTLNDAYTKQNRYKILS